MSCAFSRMYKMGATGTKQTVGSLAPTYLYVRVVPLSFMYCANTHYVQQQQTSIGKLAAYKYLLKYQLHKAVTAQGTGLNEVAVPR